MQEFIFEQDDMFSQVKSVYQKLGFQFTKQAKQSKPQKEKLIGGNVERPVKVPELPQGFVPQVPRPDAAKRLNKIPRSWTLPQEALIKPRAKYNIGTILRVQEVLLNHEVYLDQVITIGGWARTSRLQENDTLIFIAVNDGSCFDQIQVVAKNTLSNFAEVAKVNTGFSIKATGKLIKSPAKGQLVELSVIDPAEHDIQIFGTADPKTYPMFKGQQNPETLRQKAHLRPRSNFIGAVTRVRNNLAYATHLFFQQNGCQYIHTPIITASDCEGAGEMFQVTTILPKDGKIATLQEEKKIVNNQIDYTKDFFGKPVSLTVSGQLAVENFCCALSNVYTFGPTFRAEKSKTFRHLAEFWMIEPEFAFADLFDNMDAAEAYVKFCINYCLTNNIDDLKFLDERVKPGLVPYLKDIASHEFVRCSYTQGIEILLDAQKSGAQFENHHIYWGVDLNSEHERFLAERVFKRPVILYDYPKKIKAFYMKVTDDGKCVRAMDMLIPQIGELIGGSQREERYDVLVERMKECELDPKDYEFYLDLRKYGTVPHAGFGLGFERLVMMVTGVENIRDVIPFPRWLGEAEY